MPNTNERIISIELEPPLKLSDLGIDVNRIIFGRLFFSKKELTHLDFSERYTEMNLRNGNYSNRAWRQEERAYRNVRAVCREWRKLADETFDFNRSRAVAYAILTKSVESLKFLLRLPQVDPCLCNQEAVNAITMRYVSSGVSQRYSELTSISPELAEKTKKIIKIVAEDGRFNLSVNERRGVLRFLSERGEWKLLQLVLRDKRINFNYRRNHDFLKIAIKKNHLMTTMVLLNDERSNTENWEVNEQFRAGGMKKVCFAFFILYFLLTAPLLIAEIIILIKTYGLPCGSPLQLFILVCCATKGFSLFFGLFGMTLLKKFPDSPRYQFLCWGPIKFYPIIRLIFLIFHVVWASLGIAWFVTRGVCDDSLAKLALSVVVLNFISAFFSIFQCCTICCAIIMGEIREQD